MKKIMICVDIENDISKNFDRIKNFNFFNEHDIHLVHCFEVKTYVHDFAAATLPLEEDYPKIKEEINNYLSSMGQEIQKKLPKSTVVTDTIFSMEPKEALCDYIKNNNMDLVIISTEEKTGLSGVFHSSFAEYFTRNSPCDVLVVRPTS